VNQPPPDASSPRQRLLLLDLREDLYAVDSSLVREVVPLQQETRLPGAPEWIRGVMNLRGQLVTVLDLVHRITGFPGRNPEGSTIVVQSGERVIGLVVDDVRDVEELDVSDASALPHDAPGRALLKGMGRSRERVVLVIDVDELVRQTLA
jgi:purine-binding chemotaxis protein CheW